MTALAEGEVRAFATGPDGRIERIEPDVFRHAGVADRAAWIGASDPDPVLLPDPLQEDGPDLETDARRLGRVLLAGDDVRRCWPVAIDRRRLIWRGDLQPTPRAARR